MPAQVSPNFFTLYLGVDKGYDVDFLISKIVQGSSKIKGRRKNENEINSPVV